MDGKESARAACYDPNNKYKKTKIQKLFMNRNSIKSELNSVNYVFVVCVVKFE